MSRYRVLNSAFLIAVLLLILPACAAPSTPGQPSVREGADESESRRLSDREVNLDGLVVSLETSSSSLGGENSPQVLEIPEGLAPLHILLTAVNSTEATISGVSVRRNMPTVTDLNGKEVAWATGGSVADGTFGPGGGYTPSPRPDSGEGFTPGGTLTAWMGLAVTPGQEYEVTWRLSPERIARFKVR